MFNATFVRMLKRAEAAAAAEVYESKFIEREQP
jgi:hypothetical protein